MIEIGEVLMLLGGVGLSIAAAVVWYGIFLGGP